MLEFNVKIEATTNAQHNFNAISLWVKQIFRKSINENVWKIPQIQNDALSFSVLSFTNQIVYKMEQSKQGACEFLRFFFF